MCIPNVLAFVFSRAKSRVCLICDDSQITSRERYVRPIKHYPWVYLLLHFNVLLQFRTICINTHSTSVNCANCKTLAVAVNDILVMCYDPFLCVGYMFKVCTCMCFLTVYKDVLDVLKFNRCMYNSGLVSCFFSREFWALHVNDLLLQISL